jgi:hypothetical protein
LAIEQDTTLNALVVEAFNDLLKKHGMRQRVENPLLDSLRPPPRGFLTLILTLFAVSRCPNRLGRICTVMPLF